MKEEFTEQSLFKLLGEVLGINNLDVSQTMDDLPEWDSLKHIQIITAIEEKYGIEIDFEEAISLVDIRSIFETVKLKLNK